MSTYLSTRTNGFRVKHSSTVVQITVLLYLRVLYIEHERDKAQALTQLWGSTRDLVAQALMD